MDTSRNAFVKVSPFLIFSIWFCYLADGSLSDTAVSFSQEVLDRERQRNRAGGSGGSNAGGNPNDMTGGPGGMGKKSSSTSQLSAAGNVKCDAY